MKRYTARHVLIARLAALALVALCFPQAQVRAQGMIGYIVIFPSVGLVPGESLRLTLFNPEGEPVRARAQIRHSGGANFLFGDGSVRGGTFRSFDFHRSDNPLPGEDVTGRIQLGPSFDIRMAEPRKKLAVSMEKISISDGTSSTFLVGEVLPSRSGEETIKFPDDVIIGFVRGQKLRVTLSNPQPFRPEAGSDAGSEAQHNPVSAHVKVFDGSGNLIAQSPELVIPSGELGFFDFNHDALSSPSEPGTNRKQVRIKPFFNFSSQRLSRVPASFELIDNSTGKTEVLEGHECLVFFLGGIPGN
jgi:prepilin-type processing-associated H-X9-DG protein